MSSTGWIAPSSAAARCNGMELLDNAKPQLVHNQFAATKPLPTGGGKTVEWRKFGSFDKALTPLTEGVTPDGSGISVSYITKELAQYGDYTTVSDMLDLTAIDDVVLEITDRHGANMGLTLDTVTRNEIQQGKQVLYAPAIGADGSKTEVTARGALTAACRLTSEMVAKAATQLKKMNAPTFDGKYVCILHPSVAFDLRQDEAWIAAHQYAAATELFSGEIGELHGVRFVETTEAKIFRGEDLAQNGRTLLVNGKVENNAVVAFDGGTVAAGALAGRYVLLGGERRRVVSNTGSSMTLDSAVTFADGIAVKTPGETTFDMVSQYVDEIVTVSEDEIAAAILALMENQKLVAKGAGATPVAAALFGKLPLAGKKTVCLISGGNIDVNILSRVITRGLVMSGRKTNLMIALEDKPGQLSLVSDIVSACGANVVSVHHDRSDANMAITSCFLKLGLETRDAAQLETIKQKLTEAGFKLVTERA